MFYEITPSSREAFVSDDGLRLTYADLSDYIEKFRRLQTGRTLSFCFCKNCPASAIGYLGFLNSGTVPLMLDRKTDRALAARLVALYSPSYIYAPSDMADTFPGYERAGEILDYTLLKAAVQKSVVLNGDLALLLTTSGSTGSPKLVRQSYRNIESNARAIAEYLSLTPDERAVTTLPMNYTYGLSIINSHLLAGATVLFTDKPVIMKPFWDFMKRERATSFGGVPSTYELLKKIKFFKMDLPHLRYMTQAGGKLLPELHAEYAGWAAQHGKRFIVMYGQTEATARMGYLPWEYAQKKAGSMGRAIPGGRFSLIDAHGREINEPETVGELLYEGDNVTMGYAETPDDLSRGDERGGRLLTGDMAKRDADGFYYIVGRKKRFLKISGSRVNLDEIDRLVKSEFPGVDCASSGVDDKMRVYVTDESKTDEIRRWLSDKTHLRESAFSVMFIPEIPKNEAGKTLYEKLP
ncbi:MAG: AMP-binding protein [Clostridia bacterium]|nr:AMP-binding protein [Clostridia bacterium]